jgi:hypothetical protein
MLRHVRTTRFRFPWWLPALAAIPLIVALVLLSAGTEYLEDWRILVTAGVLFAVLASLPVLRRLACDASRHRRHHRRMDRQHAFMAALTRFTFTDEGQDVPPALADEREQQPGVAVFRPRPAAPRHRAQSRRHNA